MTGLARMSLKNKIVRLAAKADGLSWAAYGPDLRRYLARRLRQPSDVDDLSQEIFERFLRAPDVVQNPRRFLFGIAANVVRERKRIARRPETYDSDIMLETAEHLEHASSPDAAEEAVLSAQIERAVEQLPPMHQMVLSMWFAEGLSYNDIAERTGLSTGSIGVYICEARARIKMSLGRS